MKNNLCVTFPNGAIMKMPIYAAIKENMKSKDIAHYGADLYIRKNTISDAIMAEYKDHTISVFTAYDTKVLWYEIKNGYDKSIG